MAYSMKVCGTCKESKPIGDFYINRSKRDGLSSCCKSCKKAYNEQHYKERGYLWKETRAQQREDNRKKAQEFICNYLLSHPCVDCGETDILVLDFDHLYDKEFNVSEKMCGGIERLQKEIDKCEVRCSNDHRRKTAERLGGNYKSKFLASMGLKHYSDARVF